VVLRFFLSGLGRAWGAFHFPCWGQECSLFLPPAPQTSYPTFLLDLSVYNIYIYIYVYNCIFYCLLTTSIVVGLYSCCIFVTKLHFHLYGWMCVGMLECRWRLGPILGFVASAMVAARRSHCLIKDPIVAARQMMLFVRCCFGIDSNWWCRRDYQKKLPFTFTCPFA
jgi:hypothetical protein